jgi:hypothetical protein
VKQIFHAGFAGVKDMVLEVELGNLSLSRPLRVIDKLGHAYLHMLVVCCRDLKIRGAHGHELS